jgi:hypothetical protein
MSRTVGRSPSFITGGSQGIGASLVAVRIVVSR